MQSVDSRDRRPDPRAVQRAILDHHATAAAAFLGGLKEQRHRTRQAAPLRDLAEHRRGTEQHRDVPVMPTGVHASRDRGLPGNLGLLLDGQRVDVGAERDRFAIAALEMRQDAGAAGEAFDEGDPELSQRLDDRGRGTPLLEHDFGERVQLAPQRDAGRNGRLDERRDLGISMHGGRSHGTLQARGGRGGDRVDAKNGFRGIAPPRRRTPDAR